MKTIKSPRILIVFCYLLVMSCGYDDGSQPDICGNISFSSADVEITDMQLEVLVQSEFKDYPTEVYGDTKYVAGDSVDFDSLVISLEAVTWDTALRNPGRLFQNTNVTERAQLDLQQSAKEPTLHFPLFRRAYACSPSLATLAEKITDITITSSNGFNDSYPSGSSLNSFFDVIYASSETEYYQYNNGNTTYFSVAQYLDQEDIQASRTTQIRLNTKPQYPDSQQFYIVITLDDGQVFILETPMINFN